MTTHDQHTEAAHSLADIESPPARTEPAPEHADSSTINADRSTAQPDSTVVGTEAPAEMPRASQAETESSSERTLFADDQRAGLSARWDSVQAGFVDDPKECVQKADGLVSDVVDQLTTGFADARSRLEERWGRGEEPSTEDLRLALKRYREFFQRLLAV